MPISVVMITIDAVIIYLLTWGEPYIIEAIKNDRENIPFLENFFIELVPSILNAVVSIAFAFIYELVAEMMNKWENYKTQTQYDNMIIFRLIVASIINQFFSMFYIVFSHSPFSFEEMRLSFTTLQVRLTTLFVIYFLKTQLLSNILPMLIVFFKWGMNKIKMMRYEKKKENVKNMILELQIQRQKVYLIPKSGNKLDNKSIQIISPQNEEVNTNNPSPQLAIQDSSQSNAQSSSQTTPQNRSINQVAQNSWRSLRKMVVSTVQTQTLQDRLKQQKIELLKIEKDMESLPTNIEREMKMPQYNTFDDFQELIMQFGFIVLFSPAFPLAPLFSFIGNVIQMRSDPMKIAYSMQRPIPFSSQSIGSFVIVLYSISFLSIITNSGIFFFFFRERITQFLVGDVEIGEKGLAIQITIIFLVENVLIFIVAFISIAVSDTPQDVADTVDKDENSKRNLLVALKKREKQERMKKFYDQQIKLFDEREKMKKLNLIQHMKEDFKKKQKQENQNNDTE
ncbi:MAG: hypothetical protein EZS28_041836 [Streblomastix strix]|uniref:Anoctamin transmembrane domain-containing protein n=1 Tax=Streblomastix strix TaxID=222440 RepID=A0A5J4TWJ8_9EUKA|nr:MAG: hypothetical protein EZS28_041836 [Streblomastix strix]